jgi:hypothetical protein
MLDLLPEQVVDELRQRFGDRFDTLTHGERLILATAAIEQVVNHARLAEISDLHPHDLSNCLARLERDGFLHAVGQSRGKVYHLPGVALISPEQVFPDSSSFGYSDMSSGHSGMSSGYKDVSTGDSGESNRDNLGCLLSNHLDAPIVDDLNLLSPMMRADLERIAEAPRNKARLKREVMEAVILEICKDRYITLNVLAKLVNRDSDTLRKTYLDSLVKSHKIRRAFPGTPTHEKQSYRSVFDND